MEKNKIIKTVIYRDINEIMYLLNIFSIKIKLKKLYLKYNKKKEKISDTVNKLALYSEL